MLYLGVNILLGAQTSYLRYLKVNSMHAIWHGDNVTGSGFLKA
jgi:hypothetical protein